MMKNISAKTETLILLTCGVVILCFSFSDSYSLLMNPRFKWLTVTGSALLVIMALAAFSSSAERSGLNTLVFTGMLALVVLGRPYIPSASGTPGMEPEPDQGLLAEIDLEQFPRTEFQHLIRDARRTAEAGEGFTIVGTAKRLDELDNHGSFALMTSVMYCCLADIFACGYRIAYDDWESIEEGQPLLICGTFMPETLDVTVPSFKFGRSMFSSVDKDLIIKTTQIIPYNRLDELPLLTELLDGENGTLFAGYLKESGLWEDLSKDGPFTVFAPVDKAVAALGDEGFTGMTPERLKDALGLHLVPGRLFTSDLMGIDSVKSLNGEDLMVDLKNSKLTIEGRRLLFTNVEARNGVLHWIYPAISKERE